MTQQQVKITKLQMIWYFVTNPFVIIFGLQFAVMLYGALTEQIWISVLSFIIPALACIVYMAEDFT